MAKQAMLFDTPQHDFQSLSWMLQIKSLYLPQSLLVYESKFPIKKIQLFTVTKFCIYPNPGCYTEKMFANALKTIKNWFLTLQPDNYLQFTKVGTRKGMDGI